MSERHPEDLPWNDVPADDGALPGSLEPDPAEVVGDEDNARDTASPRQSGERESLDARLAQEAPDRPVRGTDQQAPSLLAGDEGEDDIAAGEPDTYDPAEEDEPPAEEAAIHVVDDDRI